MYACALVAGKLGGWQVTHAFPFPTTVTGPDGQAAPEELDGQDYQMEMMKMLREVRAVGVSSAIVFSY